MKAIEINQVKIGARGNKSRGYARERAIALRKVAASRLVKLGKAIGWLLFKSGELKVRIAPGHHHYVSFREVEKIEARYNNYRGGIF